MAGEKRSTRLKHNLAFLILLTSPILFIIALMAIPLAVMAYAGESYGNQAVMISMSVYCGLLLFAAFNCED
ncbi:unnamed protein product [marine sediment metagenome]|uniref:Uncharacterized protein n=1 Tax=marine sediment metagenome TaxID=412755 RepID=X0ZWJ9_9ZZZZ